MPFSDITVLIVEDDNTLAQMWDRICTEIGFKTITSPTIKGGLEHLDADIMLCDMVLADGKAEILIDRWVEENGGPFVCVSGVLSSDQIRNLILQGAFNSFSKLDFDSEMLRTLVVRYARWVMVVKSLDGLRDEMRAQTAKFTLHLKIMWGVIGALSVLLGLAELWEALGPAILLLF